MKPILQSNAGQGNGGGAREAPPIHPENDIVMNYVARLAEYSATLMAAAPLFIDLLLQDAREE
jgi:hypothetical protein